MKSLQTPVGVHVSQGQLRARPLKWLLLLVSIVGASAAFADDLVGRASVIDGDTLEIHGARIRLWGIDAPESG